MFHQLYDCLDFMVSYVCNGNKYREADVQRKHSAAHSRLLAVDFNPRQKGASVFSLACIKQGT